MRAAAKAIGGYYPTPERVAAWLANYLTARAGAGELRAFDPCCGTGRARLAWAGFSREAPDSTL